MRIEFGNIGTGKNTPSVAPAEPEKNTLRAQCKAGPDTSSLVPETPTKTLNKSRIDEVKNVLRTGVRDNEEEM